MKLKKLLKMIDPIGDIIIWTSDNDEEAVFEGSIMDTPWWLLDLKIGRGKDDEDPNEPPMFLTTRTNEYGTKLPCLVVNLIA